MFAMEKRGYVKFGPCTPEAVVEHPEAVRQLHREFLRGGSDIIQAFSFYASEDKLVNRGNNLGQDIGVAAVNREAAKLCKEVAAEGDALTLGSLSQCPSYLDGLGEAKVKSEFRKQVQEFVKEGLDFLLCEYFEHIEEIEWAIQVCKESNKVVGATMCIGPEGDLHGISAAECAIRMHRAGADLVGVNCHFDPFISLQTIKKMKQGLDAADLHPHLMVQPIAYFTPDADRQGFISLPEFPFGLESRTLTRWDVQKFAREAYNAGVRYIGGCCGFEPYHIRAMAEELSEERGRKPAGSEKHEMWGGALKMHTKPWVRARASKEYWQNLKPASGRPCCASMAVPENSETFHESVKQTK